MKNKKLTLRLLQIILPELNIKKVMILSEKTIKRRIRFIVGSDLTSLQKMKKVGLMTLEMQVVNNDDLGKEFLIIKGTFTNL